MPMPGGGTMYRLLCGSSLIKLVALAQAPAAAAAPGGTRRHRVPLLDDLGVERGDRRSVRTAGTGWDQAA